MFNNPQQCTTIYENIRTYTKWCSTMYVNVRQNTHHYEINVVAHKSFICETFFLNRSFSYENLRITANNRDKLKKKKLRQAANFQFAPCRTLKVVSGKAPLHYSDRSAMPTWYETKICNYFNKEWFDKNVIYINDLFWNETFITLENLRR